MKTWDAKAPQVFFCPCGASACLADFLVVKYLHFLFGVVRTDAISPPGPLTQASTLDGPPVQVRTSLSLESYHVLVYHR